jgi:lipopolysaccharide export system permease protein
LSSAIDSLETRLDSTKYKIAQASFKVLHLDNNRDSTITPTTGWFFNDVSAREKQKALTNAIETTRRIKEGIPKQQEEIFARTKFLIRHKVEWHRKFFFAVVCLVLFFVGAPLGAIIRKGGLGMPTVIALGLFIFYQMLTIAGEKMAKSAIVEPYIGMWISTVILLPLSIWITYKATKESALLEKDVYSRFFKKIFGWIKIKKRDENITTVS